MMQLSEDFEEAKNEGLETRLEFKSEYGIGSCYTYKDELIHLSYLVGSVGSDSPEKKKIYDDVRI